MSGARPATLRAFVRPARPDDAAAISRIQVNAWRAGYPGIVPEDVLDALTGEPARTDWQARWASSIERPPSSRHHVLVAVAGTEVTGFAAFGPGTDDDHWPGTDAEVYALHVAPDRRGAGHTSRLLNALADRLERDRFQSAHIWVFAGETGLRDFLASAGWAPDGARRDLDMGRPVPQLRLHTALDPAGSP